MDTMYLIGDVHGKIDRYLRLLDSLPGSARSIQVGDMHVGFPGVHLPAMVNHQFIRGNHDNPQKCKDHPNYLGEYGYLRSDDIFYVGGAISIDWRIRRNGVLWYVIQRNQAGALRGPEICTSDRYLASYHSRRRGNGGNHRSGRSRRAERHAGKLNLVFQKAVNRAASF